MKKTMFLYTGINVLLLIFLIFSCKILDVDDATKYVDININGTYIGIYNDITKTMSLSYKYVLTRLYENDVLIEEYTKVLTEPDDTYKKTFSQKQGKSGVFVNDTDIEYLSQGKLGYYKNTIYLHFYYKVNDDNRGYNTMYVLDNGNTLDAGNGMVLTKQVEK